jgi:hypothetical protein
VINGTKPFITGTDIADFAQVFAQADKTKKPSAGKRFFGSASMMIKEGPDEVLKIALARTLLEAYA